MLVPPGAPGSLGCTPSRSGRANTAHQRATLRKDTRTAALASARPNSAGCSVIATLIRNSRPPPR